MFYDNNYNKKKRIDKVKVVIYVGDLDVTGKDVINVITAITVRFLLFQRIYVNALYPCFRNVVSCFRDCVKYLWSSSLFQESG